MEMDNIQTQGKENLISPEEYSSVRAEILSASEIKHNYIIAMNASVLTLLGFGIELHNHYLFLLPYMLLFTFQKSISAQNNHMIRLSAFLVVFSNDEWENGLYERSRFTKEKEYSRMRSLKVMRINSYQLGLMSSMLCIVTMLFDMHNANLLRADKYSDPQFIVGIVTIIVSMLLFFMLHLWCENTLNALSDRQYYIEKYSELLPDGKRRSDCRQKNALAPEE